MNLPPKVILVYDRKSLFLADLEKVWQKIRTHPSKNQRLVGAVKFASAFVAEANFLPIAYKLLCMRVFNSIVNLVQFLYAVFQNIVMANVGNQQAKTHDT